MTKMNDHNNQSPEEIAKFDALAHQWWDIDGPMRPLHLLNPLRLDFIVKHSDLNGKRVLDVGCGAGILTESMAKAGAGVNGIDLSQSAIAVAKQHAIDNELCIDYQVINIEQYNQQHPAQYDVITCMELLEHVPDPAAFIKACCVCLKPHGKLFFSTINRNLKSFLLAIVGAEYILKLLPKGTHRYQQFIRPSELNQWCESADLSLDNLTGIHYNPIHQTFRISDDVSVNYMACYHKQ